MELSHMKVTIPDVLHGTGTVGIQTGKRMILFQPIQINRPQPLLQPRARQVQLLHLQLPHRLRNDTDISNISVPLLLQNRGIGIKP